MLFCVNLAKLDVTAEAVEGVSGVSTRPLTQIATVQQAVKK